MKTIWKYPLKIEDQQFIEVPKNAKFLSVQMQNGSPQLWAMVKPSNDKEKVLIEIFGTGHEIPGELRNYIDTFQVHGAGLVFHVFNYFGDLPPHP